MTNDPIEEVLRELNFTPAQKELFVKFLRYAKTCQETGNIKQLKPALEEIIKEI